MKPKIKVRTQMGRKDFGELSICENGIKYKYYPAGSAPIECFILFRQIRNIAYQKYTDNCHVTTICLQLYQPVRIIDLLVEKRHAQDIQQDNNLYDHISFSCSLESEARLGMMGDKDDIYQEKQRRAQMISGNQKAKDFFANLRKQVQKYCDEIGKNDLGDSIMQGNYICNLLVPTKELRITGSVE